MSIKEDLHRFVDELPERALPAAFRQLERLRDAEDDPYLVALMNVPLDDEPTTPEEDAGAAEAWQEYLRGEGRPWREVREGLASE